MLAQGIAKPAKRVCIQVQLIDQRLQQEGFASGLQAPAYAGKQHEAELLLGFMQCRAQRGYRQLQPFGRMVEVAGLQDRLDHFDVA